MPARTDAQQRVAELTALNVLARLELPPALTYLSPA